MSPIVSQTLLTILLMALGISITAFALGRVKKPGYLQRHRLIRGAAILILVGTVV